MWRDEADCCFWHPLQCNRAEVAIGADCSECEKKGIKVSTLPCTVKHRTYADVSSSRSALVRRGSQAAIGLSPVRRLTSSFAFADSYIANKPRVVRSGKLIQRAKELYGDHHHLESTPSELDPSSRGTSSTPAPPLLGGLRRASSRTPQDPGQSVIRAAEARFVSSELGRTISAHLVQNYFDVVHEQCHLVDAEPFLKAWDAAGRDTDMLSPSYDCLALVIQAWSARFSDHHTILGPGAPQLVELTRGKSQDSLCGWGDKRQT